YGGVELYDRETGKSLRSFAGDNTCYGFAVSPDGTRLATACATADFVLLLRIWDLATGKLLAQPGQLKGYIRALGFSADGKRLIAASSDARFSRNNVVTHLKGGIGLWDLTAGQQLHEMANEAQNLVVSPDGETVARDDANGGIQVLNVAAGK